MRIWSLHPKHLDAKGLVALWRETLLAKNVLEGNTKGYKNHPQLDRFKESGDPLGHINHYLSHVYEEASKRGYNFNRDKINWSFERKFLNVTNGQMEFERNHLLKKLEVRDQVRYAQWMNVPKLETHPQFILVLGPIASWEIV